MVGSSGKEMLKVHFSLFKFFKSNFLIDHLIARQLPFQKVITTSGNEIYDCLEKRRDLL